MGVPAMQHAAIVGWGKCLPPAVLSNKDLESFFETSDDWITQRTGIHERRVSHVLLGEMAYVAAERALAAAGMARASDIELIVFGTCSHDEQVPNMASGLQRRHRRAEPPPPWTSIRPAPAFSMASRPRPR